jgi:hypothetical protein
MYLYVCSFRVAFEAYSRVTSWLRSVCVSKNALGVIFLYLDSSCAREFAVMHMYCDSLFNYIMYIGWGFVGSRSVVFIEFVICCLWIVLF